MESSYTDDEIKRLHASFVEAMESDRNYASFSEDDLIDVFDYSCSISDDYVITEVIIAGERYFQNSRELLKRKALMYHRFEQDRACELILNQLPSDSFLNLIVSVKNEQSNSHWLDNFRHKLGGIESGTIEDGDMMYAVDFFESLNRVDVLMSLSDELSRISEYSSTIYNELMHLLWEKGDYSDALDCGRKLTDIEPFNALAWTELADLYNVHLGNHRMAIECADFALAIEPNSIGALMVKSSALYESNPEESRKIVSNIMKLAPLDSMSFYARAILNINDGKREQGVSDILYAISLKPNSGRRELIELLFKVIDKPLLQSEEGIIRSFFEEEDSYDAVKWCNSLITSGCYVGAYMVFKLSYEVSKYDFAVPDAIYLAVEALYRMKYYNQVIQLLDSGCKNSSELRLNIPMPLALIYSLAWFRSNPENSSDIITYINSRLELYIMSANSCKITERLIEEASVRRMKLLGEELTSNMGLSKLYDIDPFV